ncbi:MAG: plastocyanin/azurin family copper-binding protein, partial [Acidobacteriota bacterium]|nr:plastocyanin/azurin family copper-binding protein [Acidobacteriota bacterium]
MRRRPLALARSVMIALALLASLASPVARAANFAVQTGPGDSFSPMNLSIQVGDSVTFTNTAQGFHNVSADDGSFRCANGCDGQGGDGNPSSSAWTFTRTFGQAGSVGYHCEIHGSPGGGMHGTITVAGSPPPPQNGVLGFTANGYDVQENGGMATIRVGRTSGTGGAVSVNYVTQPGSAAAGVNFTSVSGTLNWGDGDGTQKSFQVPILDDHHVDPSLTVGLRLMNPAGGATLGTSQATLTIHDTDHTPPPPAPGTLALSSASYSGNPGGSVPVGVTRSGGTSGAVSVAYATSDGSALSGVGYTPTSGILSWGDGDAATKSFTVALLSGGGTGSTSFNVALSSPTGGAVLGSPSAAAVLVLGQTPPPQPLTADEEACDEFRTNGLLGRIAVTAPNSRKATGINLSFTRTGDFTGIAYTGNGPGTPEHHLAFSTNPEETTFLRNPARPQLFSVSLTRNALNSDLVSAGDPDQIGIVLNPTLGSPTPAAELAVDNLVAGGSDSDAKPGRGLTPLLALCHNKLTDRDAQVLRVLTKVARASAATGNAQIAIFRGAGTDRYRIDLYPLDGNGQQTGRLAVELQVTFGEGNVLASATMDILPRCSGVQTSDCTSSGAAELDLIKPEPAGTLAPATPYKVFT